MGGNMLFNPDRKPQHACYSRSGWWQTLCGLDAANQGFGWTDNPTQVGCVDCLKRIDNDEHIARGTRDVMFKPKRSEAVSNYDDRTPATEAPKAVTSAELKAEIEAAAKVARESRNTAIGAAKEALRKAIVAAACAGETNVNVASDVLPRSLPRTANETLRVWLAEAGVSVRFMDDQRDGSYFELKW